MGAVYVIQGILIYIYAFDHNPPHVHVKVVKVNSQLQLWIELWKEELSLKPFI